MRMTSRVIQETMRVASILSFTFREAVEDVEYQGEGGLQLAILIRFIPCLRAVGGSVPVRVRSAASELDGGGGGFLLTERGND
jgi:hypothetical protein